MGAPATSFHKEEEASPIQITTNEQKTSPILALVLLFSSVVNGGCLGPGSADSLTITFGHFSGSGRGGFLDSLPFVGFDMQGAEFKVLFDGHSSRQIAADGSRREAWHIEFDSGGNGKAVTLALDKESLMPLGAAQGEQITLPRESWTSGAEPFLFLAPLRLVGQTLSKGATTIISDFLGYNLEVEYHSRDVLEIRIPLQSNDGQGGQVSSTLSYRITLKDGFGMPAKVERQGTGARTWEAQLQIRTDDVGVSGWSPPDAFRPELDGFHHWPAAGENNDVPFPIGDAVTWAKECDGSVPIEGCDRRIREFIEAHRDFFVPSGRLQDITPIGSISARSFRWDLVLAEPNGSELAYSIEWYGSESNVPSPRPLISISNVRTAKDPASMPIPDGTELVTTSWAYGRCREFLQIPRVFTFSSLIAPAPGFVVAGRPEPGFASYACSTNVSIGIDAYTGLLSNVLGKV